LALDISSAFDAVDHSTLTDRARTAFGIHDVALDWLRSFVTERTQQIAVGSEKSAVFPCASGVPQDSVSGPILFGMYVSSIGDVISQHNVQYHQYADDMQLYVSLNPGTSQRLSQVNKSQGVWVAEAHVQFTDAVKLLAVTLDSTLSFDKHIIDVTRSCHYHIRAVRHIRPLLTFDAAKATAV